MKIRFFYLLLILLTNLTSCTKENENCENPIDCLPPATQTGTNSFGCLVDGKVLVPSGSGFGTGSVLKSQYSTFEGKTLFGIVVRDIDADKSLYLELRSETIKENKTYPLGIVSDTTDYAFYYGEEPGKYETNENITGEIYFSRVDFSRRIASGTFWFDAQNRNGDIAKIREGRFDVIFF